MHPKALRFPKKALPLGRIKTSVSYMNIFVGSLPYRMQEGELKDLFSEFGDVAEARIIKDRTTGRSKGYGFVEMPDDGAAQRAIQQLNGDFHHREF